MVNRQSFSDPLLSRVKPADRKQMLELSTNTLRALLLKEDLPNKKYEGLMIEKAGVFVTLKRDGDLRGCVGYPDAIFPLWEAIRKSTISSAVMDSRFREVRKEELPELKVEITVLAPKRTFQPDEDKLEIGKHGLIIENPWTSGLLLPQVAVEESFSVEEFLDATCMKAGLPPGSWKEPDVILYFFEGLYFQD
jgi:uncharacterized protein (TIGR00296 family)